MITVIGIFEEYELAEEAVSYLLANEFETENIDLHKIESTERIADFFNQLFVLLQINLKNLNLIYILFFLLNKIIPVLI